MEFLKRLFQKKTKSQDVTAASEATTPEPTSLADPIEEAEASGDPEAWFKDPAEREPPQLPGDFELFEVPSFENISEWAENVATSPWNTYVYIVPIAQLGSAARTLFDVLNRKYDLSSDHAVPLFDEYLGAACPECFSGLTGELLQTVESYKRAAGTVVTDHTIARVLNGQCPHCDSSIFYVVWHGDDNFREFM